MKYTKEDEIRFWSKVRVTRDNNSCWYWTASKHRFGYGWFRINNRSYTAHRLALIFFNGGIEEKGQVLHSCDNPSCCNPNHLRWGTQKDNIHDAMRRGRHVKPPINNINPPVRYGEDNNMSIMDKDKVKLLRDMFSDGISARDLSREFGISVPTVYQIINFRTWRNI